MIDNTIPESNIYEEDSPIRGVIFDMDGLLLDSETLAIEALITAGAELGHDVPNAFCRQMVGLPADDCRALVSAHYGAAFPLDRFFALQEKNLRHFVDNGRLALKAGVLPLLDWLDQHDLPRAIATSSSRTRTEHHLKLVGLYDRFDAIVTRDDVSRGKPAPEPYLLAAEKIGVPPEFCLALEDSHNGARAAYAAGIRVIVVPDLLEANAEIRDKALAVVDNLQAVHTYLDRAHLSHRERPL